MQRLFVVIRTHGPAWQNSNSMEDQDGWPAHAAFMNSLENDGFVILGGPLEGAPEVLLVVRAGSAEEVHARLKNDPWTAGDLLHYGRRAGRPSARSRHRHRRPASRSGNLRSHLSEAWLHRSR